MKKRKIGLIVILGASFILAGCAATPVPSEKEQVEIVQESLERQPVKVSESAGNSAAAESIGEEKALELALAHAGVKASDTLYSHVKLDYDDGRQEYDVEFFAGNQEYDYNIDAFTGEILSFDSDMEYDYRPSQTADSGSNASSADKESEVTIDTAREIALAKVPGATGDHIRIVTDYDDGRTVYEGKIIYDNMEYEFEIDASSGAILEWDVESVYD